LAGENILLLAEFCILNGSSETAMAVLKMPFYPKTTLAIIKV